MTAGGSIPRVDPLVPANAATRLLRRAFEIRLVGRFLIWVAADLDPFLHWWTRGRLGHLVPMPFASMTTTGARSGVSRTTAVIYFNDGDDVILIASNYGGTRRPRRSQTLPSVNASSLSVAGSTPVSRSTGCERRRSAGASRSCG
jgi:hypothetical protein